MGEGYVAQQMRRANRNALLFAGITVLLVAAATAAGWRYLYNCVRGPFPTDPFQLLTVNDPDSLQQYFITVPAGQPVDTGGAEEKDGVVQAKFLAVVVGHRLLLVKAPTGTPGKEFRGYLTTIDDEVRSKIVAPTEGSQPDLHGAFLPVMLNASDSFREELYWGGALAGGLLLVAFLVLRTNYASEPTDHPIMRRLAKLGPAPELAASIDQEMNSGQVLKFGASALLTHSWLLQASTFSLRAVRFQDLVWLYKKVTQHRVNFVPTGKTYAVMLWDRNKTTYLIELGRKQETGDALLQELVRRAPWALAGYSPDLFKLWQKDFRGVVAAVDERKARAKSTS